MSAALTSLPAIAKRTASREPDALAAREVDQLVSRLLNEIKVPFSSLGTRVLTQLADLKRILSTDYADVPALPQKPLLKELAQVVEKDIKQHIPTYGSLSDLGSPQLLGHLGKLFGPRELELRAEPYRTGAGLSLRGFYCRADLGKKSKFVIFVNTAHHPGAVGATLGHELGHFIYGSLVGEKAAHTAFMEGAFANHLEEEDELFADSLVALAAYSPELIKKIGGVDASQAGFFGRSLQQPEGRLRHDRAAPRPRSDQEQDGGGVARPLPDLDGALLQAALRAVQIRRRLSFN